MRIQKTKVYQFSELNESAKETARQWYRTSDTDNFFAESVIEDAVTIGQIMGIDFDTARGSKSEPAVYWSGFSSQGDGASFTGSYKYKPGACKALKAHAPIDAELARICKALQDAQKRVFYSANCIITSSGRYSHAYTMQFAFDMNDVSQAVFSDVEETISEALRDFANWIYRQLETEYDYQNADEQVDESIESNEYEFTEDGNIA